MRHLSYDMRVRLLKAGMRGLISNRARWRILANYPWLSPLDWLRLWWAMRGIRA